MLKINESIEKLKVAGLITEYESIYMQLKEIDKFKKVYDYVEKEVAKKEDGVKYKGNSKIVKAAVILDMIDEEYIELTKEDEEKIDAAIKYFILNYDGAAGLGYYWNMEALKKYAGLYEGYKNIIDNAEAAGSISRMVEGGCFRIYYDDIKEFINTTGLNPDKKEYDNEKSWQLYIHLCVNAWAWFDYLMNK